MKLHETVPSTSFLEYAFLRWVLSAAADARVASRIVAQAEVDVGGRTYRIDYEIRGETRVFAVELDGFEFHGSRHAFSYDRLRQNDLHATGRQVVRFSYDSVRCETARCIAQLQAVLRQDPLLAGLLVADPVVEIPDMDPDPLAARGPSPQLPRRLETPETPEPDRRSGMTASYFDTVRGKLNRRTLRQCQDEAFTALANYYGSGGRRAACIMSVGAGKTALGVLAALAFTQRRALVVTPGSVIRGTFHKALHHEELRNVLYGLPGGPLIPGCRPPEVRTLDRQNAAIKDATRDELLSADIIVTNFHSLGTGEGSDDLLSKLLPGDIDFVVVDEAHIAAAESYQRTFAHFAEARSLLMSACFQRLDGKPIDADVVYRYRLIDSIADGNAKSPRVQRFQPDAEETTYEIVHPDGLREEIVGRDALLESIRDERRLARITAKSDEPIRQIVRAAKAALDRQTEVLHPVKPRVLFSALGERHAEQITRIANEYGIPCEYLHHSMTERRIRDTRERFERESGDLSGIVQLKMLGQGYDHPPIAVVVPMRPYGSFSEFYQFIGRGIRVVRHPALDGRVGPGEQLLEVIYHAELGLDTHIETIYEENDMDPRTGDEREGEQEPAGESGDETGLPGTTGNGTAERAEAFVLFERGTVDSHVVHDPDRVEQRRQERELEALAQKYASYAESSRSAITFEEYVAVIRSNSERDNA